MVFLGYAKILFLIKFSPLVLTPQDSSQVFFV